MADDHVDATYVPIYSVRSTYLTYRSFIIMLSQALPACQQAQHTTIQYLHYSTV